MINVTMNGHSQQAVPEFAAPEVIVPRSVTTLTWEDGPYAGLRVRVRMRRTVLEALESFDAQDGVELPPAKYLLELRCRGFAAALISWNLTALARDEDGEAVLDGDGKPRKQPVPATLEGLLSLDTALVTTMLDKFDAEYRVPDPFSPAPSSSSPPSPASSETTEPPSPARRNSTKRSGSRPSPDATDPA